MLNLNRTFGSGKCRTLNLNLAFRFNAFGSAFNSVRTPNRTPFSHQTKFILKFEATKLYHPPHAQGTNFSEE
jgi:hypothetical protein